MAAYFIGTIDIEDAETFDLYRSLNPSVVEAAGGKYIIKGQPVSRLEGDDFRSRFVMIEFASEAALQRFYNSPEYAALRPLRERYRRETYCSLNDASASSGMRVTGRLVRLSVTSTRLKHPAETGA